MFRSSPLALALLLAATAVQAQTIRTGDTIEGVPVITQLSVDDLAPGQVHRFLFRGADMGTAQYWYVPVMVAKGVRTGKRVLLVAGVHGDELNPIGAVQQVFAEIQPATLAGAVIGIVGFNRPGVEYVTRSWPTVDLGKTLINPNRVWPGKEFGNTVERHAWLMMNRLIKGNVDIGVDMHTGGNGIDFALFVFADPQAESQRIAGLFPVDQIMTSPSFAGTLEYGLNQAGIPAVTLEIGGPREFDPKMIEAGVIGARNLFSHYGLTTEPLGQTARDRNVYRGNDLYDMFADAGGFVTLLVGLNDPVRKGQKVAVQRNSFGDVVHEYITTVDGRVAIIGTDAVRERGVDVVSILTNTADCGKDGCAYDGEER
jgi:predicted deacylase